MTHLNGLPPANLPHPYVSPASQPPLYSTSYHSSNVHNPMAIVALIFAFIVPPVGVVLGHIALKQNRERGSSGSGLAVTALIVGYVFLVGAMVLLVKLAMYFANSMEIF